MAEITDGQGSLLGDSGAVFVDGPSVGVLVLPVMFTRSIIVAPTLTKVLALKSGI